MAEIKHTGAVDQHEVQQLLGGITFPRGRAAPLDWYEHLAGRRAVVAAVLRELNDASADLLLEAHEAGASLREIGERTDLTVGRVHLLVGRARERRQAKGGAPAAS